MDGATDLQLAQQMEPMLEAQELRHNKQRTRAQIDSVVESAVSKEA